ncbi:MAG: hypothetical protein K0R78_1975 [Pelosinus sp.]|jgi:uncharacterized pyridoxamine 5'-phosphate oxidase family protein|nr:hypothetical protein [Pelosinus sp.]
MEKMDFTKLKEEAVKILEKNKFMALSTCLDNYPRIRMVSIIHDDLTIYFITLNTSDKFQQLQGNSRVAFCMENMHGEGVVEIVHQPLVNTVFSENYKVQHEKTHQVYGHLQSNVVIKIIPTLISLYKYKPEWGGYLEHLDVSNHNTYRELYIKSSDEAQ